MMNTLSAGSLMIYGILLLLGGAIGFFKAGSKASLIAGGITGAIGLGLGWAEWQGWSGGLWAGIGFGLFMAVFMGVRFVRSGKPMPSLPIVVLGLTVAIIHVIPFL